MSIQDLERELSDLQPEIVALPASSSHFRGDPMMHTTDCRKINQSESQTAPRSALEGRGFEAAPCLQRQDRERHDHGTQVVTDD